MILREGSFTYISKIENGAMPAPSEDTIKKIAAVLGEDADDMLLLAKKIPSDFKDVIYQNEEIPAFLRKAPSLTKDQWAEIRNIVEKTEGNHDDKE